MWQASMTSGRLQATGLSGSGGLRDGQYSIRVSRGWRICFVWNDGDAFEVELTKHYD